MPKNTQQPPSSNEAAVLTDRLAVLETLSLKPGGHVKPPKNALPEGCAIELVSWLAGESWSDRPQCVCPTLAAFFRNWNDGLPNDEDRDRLLKPFLPRLIGTNDGRSLERSKMVWEWMVTIQTPTWLRLAGLEDEAYALETSSPENRDERLRSASRKANAARAAAGDAAWDASWDAAGDASWAAARAAARDASWDAAGDAAKAALKPSVDALQDSAVDLVERMLTLPAKEAPNAN